MQDFSYPVLILLKLLYSNKDIQIKGQTSLSFVTGNYLKPLVMPSKAYGDLKQIFNLGKKAYPLFHF